MLRKTPWLAAVLLASTGVGLLAQAQEAAAPAKRPSLSQRLGSFRRTLLGGEEEPGAGLQPQPDELNALEDPRQTPRQGSNLNAANRGPMVTPAGPTSGGSSRRRRTAAGAGAPRTAQSSMPDRGTPRAAGSLQQRLGAMRDPGAGGDIVIPSESDFRNQTGPTATTSRGGQPTLARSRPVAVEPAEDVTPEEPEANATAAAPARGGFRTARAPQAAGEPTVADSSPTVAKAASALDNETLPSAPPSTPAPAAPVAAPAAPSAAVVATATPAVREAERPNLLISRRSPLLTVDVSGPETVTVGKSSTYVVAVQNSGDVPAHDVVVTVMIPAWADLTEAKPTGGNAANPLSPDRDKEAEHYEPLQWKLPRLEGKGRERLALKLTPRKSRRFDLAVQWTFSPVSSQAMVEVREPKLEMSISGPQEVFFGEKKIYRLTLANPGTGDAENIALHVQVGRGQDQSATDRLPLLKAGESKVIELELEARQPGSLAILAHAVADNGLQSELAEEIVVRRAALTINVEAPPSKYARSEALYRIHVANPGNAKAENVEIVAHLPPGAQLLAAGRGAAHDTANNRLTWIMPSLAAETEQVFELRCLLQQPGENRLRVDAAAAGDLAAVGGGATQVEAIADLKLDIKDPPGAVAVGEEVIYELIVSNRGTKQADNVEVFAYFSPGIEPVSVEGGEAKIAAGEGLVEFAPLGSLPAGAEVLLKVRAKADRAGSHVFRGEVVCQPLEIKLAADEITRFYGSEPPVAVAEAPGETKKR